MSPFDENGSPHDRKTYKKMNSCCSTDHFSCPCVFYRWFCEGKELENSPDIQIITNGELHSLIIAEAFEEDTGRYSCFASNFYGTDSTSAEIYVEGEALRFLPRTFTCQSNTGW